MEEKTFSHQAQGISAQKLHYSFGEGGGGGIIRKERSLLQRLIVRDRQDKLILLEGNDDKPTTGILLILSSLSHNRYIPGVANPDPH